MKKESGYMASSAQLLHIHDAVHNRFHKILVRQPNPDFGAKLALECYSFFFNWFWLVRPSIWRIHMLELCQHWAILDIRKNPKWLPAAILDFLFPYFFIPRILKTWNIMVLGGGESKSDVILRIWSCLDGKI